MRLLAILLFLIGFQFSGVSQIEMRIQQVIPVNGVDSLYFEVLNDSTEVNFTESYSTAVTVETVISFDYGSPSIVEQMVMMGRYKLDYRIENGELIISPKKDNPVVKIGDIEANEKLSYYISVPAFILY